MAAYLKIETPNIEGESQDKNHEKWIKVMSISQGLNRPIQIGADKSSTKGSVTCGDIALMKESDKATPELIGAVCKGTKFGKILIDFCTDTGQGERVPYLQWELKNAYVSSFNVSGSDGGTPTESLTLTYEEITWTYTPIDEEGKPGGPIPQTWKVGKGTE